MSEQDFQGRISTGDVEIGTPDEIYLPLHEEFNFTFDLAASAQNTKCERYFSKENSALTQDWPRETCWLNPPYSRRVGEWVEKAYLQSRKGSTVVMLLNSNTESSWYHDVAVPQAHEIRHLRWRIGFIKNGVKQVGGYHPSCVLVFNPDPFTVPIRETVTDGKRLSYVTF